MCSQKFVLQEVTINLSVYELG